MIDKIVLFSNKILKEIITGNSARFSWTLWLGWTNDKVGSMKNIQQCLLGRDFSKLMECPLCWGRLIVMDEWKGKIRTTIWSLAREGATILTSADRVVCEQVDARWVRGAGERYSRSDYTFTFLTSHWDRGNGVVSLFKWRLWRQLAGWWEGGLNRRVALPAPYSTAPPPSPSPFLSLTQPPPPPIQSKWGRCKNAT